MDSSPTGPPADQRSEPERLRRAIETFYARSGRQTQPDGSWQEGLWVPSAAERRACCAKIRPSPANRQALESHCRSQGHVAALFGVPLAELKGAVREDRKRGSPIAREVASTYAPSRPPRDASLAELGRRTREERFERLREALSHGLPLFERLRAIGDAGLPSDEDVVPLLEMATAGAERLTEALRSARSAESILTLANALLESLEALVEPSRSGKRTSRGSD